MICRARPEDPNCGPSLDLLFRAIRGSFRSGEGSFRPNAGRIHFITASFHLTRASGHPAGCNGRHPSICLSGVHCTRFFSANCMTAGDLHERWQSAWRDGILHRHRAAIYRKHAKTEPPIPGTNRPPELQKQTCPHAGPGNKLQVWTAEPYPR